MRAELFRPVGFPTRESPPPGGQPQERPDPRRNQPKREGPRTDPPPCDNPGGPDRRPRRRRN